MTPIDEHLYDNSRDDVGPGGVAAPTKPESADSGTFTSTLNVARMRQILSERGRNVVDAIDPLQKKLDLKLHELDETLRPKLQEPVKEKPLIAVAISTGVGLVIGALATTALLAGGSKD